MRSKGTPFARRPSRDGTLTFVCRLVSELKPWMLNMNMTNLGKKLYECSWPWKQEYRKFAGGMKTTLGKESLVEKQHYQTLVFCSRNSLLRCSSVALPYQAFLQCWGRFSSLKTNRKQCLLQICEIPVFRVTSLHTSKLHHVLFMLSIHDNTCGSRIRFKHQNHDKQVVPRLCE